MITKLQLKNFRKFKNKTLTFSKPITVIYGDNAKGKSSILESLYLLCNGKSPWTVSDDYVKNNQKETVPYSRIEIEKDGITYSFFKDRNSKITILDGKKVSTRKFLKNNAATIYNPEKIEILLLSSQKRRDFLDEAISHFDDEYAYDLKNFKRVLRQRNAYLKKLAKKFYESGIIARNDPQLNIWTKEYIKISVKIVEKRDLFIQELSDTDSFKLEYITNYDTKDIEKSLTEILEESKRRDIATGYSNIGPHRDDWEIIHKQNIKKFGSRGEKRLAIGKLIFNTHEIIANKTGFYPILLLDDIASELDKKNTQKIFNQDTLSKQQTFITVIDIDTLPKELLENSDLIKL